MGLMKCSVCHAGIDVAAIFRFLEQPCGSITQFCKFAHVDQRPKGEEMGGVQFPRDARASFTQECVCLFH